MSKDDVVPGLLELIKNQIDEELKNDSEINKLLDEVEDISQNFHNAYRYGYKTGQVVSNALVKNITTDNLPNGQMYFNISDRILNDVLHDQFNRISSYATKVQTLLNEQAGMHIKAISSELNESKIAGLVEIMSRNEDLEKNIWAIQEPIVNFSQTIIDDTIATNAEHHFKSGLVPKIIRTSDGKCCAWCDKVVGEYKYPNVPKDVYRRHKNCQCEVAYYPGDGKVKKTHSKELDREREERIEFSNQNKNDKLKNLAEYHARELGYNPVPTDKVVKVMREQAKDWLPTLDEHEKRSITKYSFNGMDDDRKKLYFKLNGLFSNYYIPKDDKEEEMLIRNIGNITKASLKFNLSNDIIVYRKDKYPSELVGSTKKFISTSILPKATLTGEPNVAIIVPKGAQGAYIEPLSYPKYKKQLEFLININQKLDSVYSDTDIHIFKLEVPNEK